jgi:hypothetical protein
MSQLPLAVCAIFQNEAPFLREWIEFHRLVGVGHFVLYDNLSEDDSVAVLQPYCDEGLVTLVPWPVSFEEFAQTRAYNDCLHRFGTGFRWLAMLDIDEFLFSPEEKHLPTVLDDYTEFPGVLVNWQVYGSSGHIQSPGGLVIENFVNRAPTAWIRNKKSKTIIDPSRTKSVLNAHYAEYIDGALAVNENREPAKVILRNRACGQRWPLFFQRVQNRLYRELIRFFPRIPVDPYRWSLTTLRDVSVSRLRINHYVIKSREQYVEKKKRRRILGEYWSGLMVQDESRFKYHDRNDVHDDILIDYVAPLRRTLDQER